MENTNCAICGMPVIGYGNNPWPLADSGRCCDACNGIVIAIRLERLLLRENETVAHPQN